MKWKWPRFFDVFGQKTPLKFVEMDNRFAAQYDITTKEISVNKNHQDDDVMHSVLHELGHALFFRVSINQSVSYEVHEFIVNNYATMLRENFDLKPKIKK